MAGVHRRGGLRDLAGELQGHVGRPSDVVVVVDVMTAFSAVWVARLVCLALAGIAMVGVSVGVLSYDLVVVGLSAAVGGFFVVLAFGLHCLWKAMDQRLS